MSPSQQRGDPDGQRIAMRKAAALTEAARLTALAESRLRLAEINELDFTSLRNEIAALEKQITGVGSREVEGRRRYRGKKRYGRSALPGNDLFFFVDESGSWKPPSIEGDDDWFALGAIAMTKGAVDRYIAFADEVKVLFFDHNTVTFHEPQMRRGEEPFHFLGNDKERARLSNAVNLLVTEADFTAFGVGIRKRELFKNAIPSLTDPYLPTDPYPLALHLLLERFVDFLAYHPNRPRATIVMESQAAHLDALHQLTVAETVAKGTQYVSPQGFERFVRPGVEFVRKRGSHPTELADMLARDVFEWIKGDCAGEPLRWALFDQKLYRRGDLRRGKFGLKIFPDSDIRRRIEENRRR